MFARPGESFVIQKLTKIAAYRRIAARLSAVETARQSGVIRVTYSSDDPNDASTVLSRVADAYVDQNVARGAEDASKALAFLEQQLPMSKKAMEASEEALSQYQISRQSISLDKEATSLLDRSVSLGKAKLDADMKRGQLLQVFKPDHPQVQAIDQQIRQIEADQAQLATEVKRLPDTQQGLLTLSRDMKINTDIYTSLLSSAEQYKVAKAGTIGNVRVVDAAAASPLPTKPNRTAIVSVAAALGFLLAVTGALVRRAIQPSFRSAEDVERKLGLPVYGTVPESKIQSSLFVRRKNADRTSRLLHSLAPGDIAVESLRSMNVALQFAMADATNKNILITGPTSSLGKSFVSANLAAVLGAAGKRVLLIETDMRRPRLHQYFGVGQTPGLSELLAGTGTVGSGIHPGVAAGVDLITSGTIPPNPSELLVNGRVSALLDWAQPQYDIIILDSPPLLPVGDAVIVSRYAGAIFMVLRFEQSSPAQAIESVRRLENVGSKVKGIIFNGLKLDRLRYGYQYRQYYEYST
jgi:tyrosine-protein kinase Etk/Wzc